MSLPSVFGTYHDITGELTRRIAPRLEGGAQIEILIPSRAIASSITRSLLRLLPHGFSGVVLHTPDSLAKKLFNERGDYPHVASDAERSLAMTAATASIDPSLRIPGIAAMLDRTYRDLRDSGLTIDLFAARERRMRDLARTRSVVSTWRRYEQNLRAINAADPADILDRAAGFAKDARPQIVFGFYDMTGTQEKLFRALAGAGNVESIFVPVPLAADTPATPYGFAAPFVSRLRSLGVDVTSKTDAVPASWSITAHDSIAAELRSVCRSAKRLIDGGLAIDDVGIAVRSVDRHEAESLARIALEYGLPLATNRVMDLRGHRFGRAVVRLLRLRDERFPRGQVIAILRDGLWLEGATRNAINAADRATREAEIAGGPPELVRRALAGIDPRRDWLTPQIAPFARWVTELWDITAGFDKPRRGREWAATIRGLLEKFRPETEADLAALEGLESTAELLARGDAFGARLSSEDVVAMIEASEPIVLESPRRGLWFGDVMSLRGRSFDTVFLIGMQQDRFPQRRVEDPLLPDVERRVVGMPVIGDGRDEETMLLELARSSARRHIELAFSSSDLAGRLLRASSFIQALAFENERDVKKRRDVYRDFAAYVREKMPPPPDAPLSPSELRRAAMREHPSQVTLGAPLQRAIRNAQRAGTRSEYDGFLTAGDALASQIREIAAKVSPTSLEDFGDCPHKFFVGRLLGISELADPDNEPQMHVRDKGTLDHSVLEKFYRGAPALEQLKHPELPRLSETGRKRLRQIVAEVFDEFDKRRPPFNETIRRIERSISLAGLERFLGRDLQDLFDAGLRPSHLEYAFGTDREGPPDYPDPVPLHAGDLEFAIRGRIDRIDAAEDGRRRIVDYKSYASKKYLDIALQVATGRRIQLALYAMAIQTIFGLPDEALSGVIKGIRGETKLEKLSFGLAECKEELLRTLETFAVAITRGQFPAFPEAESCKYCAVNFACRSKYDAEEQRALAEYENALELIRELENR